MKKILLLPGLGDVHWVFLKLQSWLAEQGPEWDRPEISIWNIDNRPRTLEYLQFVPWVQVGRYVDLPLEGENKRLFDAIYTHKGTGDVVFNFHGFDALIGTNGNMRHGINFARILQGAEVNFDYGPVLPPSALPAEPPKRPYFVLCFSGNGMFGTHWIKRMPAPIIRDLVSKLHRRFPGHEFVFTGCSWDDEFSKTCLGPKDFSLVGKTSLVEFFHLLKNSSGYIGWCGGNSILAQHLGVPTVEWWSKKYFKLHDRRGWETSQRNHFVLEVEDYKRIKTPETVANYLEGAMQHVAK